jgi:hypothetical protein
MDIGLLVDGTVLPADGDATSDRKDPVAGAHASRAPSVERHRDCRGSSRRSGLPVRPRSGLITGVALSVDGARLIIEYGSALPPTAKIGFCEEACF